MKRIALADIHLSAYKDDAIDNKTGLPERLSYIIQAIQLASNYAIENKIEFIDIAGDLHNDKDVIYTDSQNAFINHVLLKYPQIKYTLVSGNHDLSSSGDFCTSCIEPYKAYSNVTCVIDRPLVDKEITFIPYTKNIKDNILELEPNNILVSHLGLSEAVLQSGLSIITNIKASDLSKYRLSILGHYHKAQKLMYGKFSIYYVGNPITVSWHDKNEQKRFLVYDTETFEVQSIPFDGFYKKYIELVIDDPSKIKDILGLASIEREKGNHVKIRKRISDEIKNTEDLNIIDDTEVDIRNRGIDTSMSRNDRLLAYLKLKNIPDNKKDLYMKVAKEIIL